jgi:N-acetylneuraminate synthase/N,N'-diacetyllegionaminate synthase
MGYSDHTTDGVALRVAAALGAQVLEFHFTDTREGKEFRDHAVSLTSDEVRELAAELRIIGEVLGDGEKRPLDSEIETGHVTSFRRGTYFARDLPAGHVIEQGDLVLLRPEHGLPAWHSDAAIGRRLTTPVAHLDRVDLAATE